MRQTRNQRAGPSSDHPWSRSRWLVAWLFVATLLSHTSSHAGVEAPHWTRTGDLNDARARHTATRLLNGLVLVAGGEARGAALSSTELYDPMTGLWTRAGNMQEARSDHTATLLPGGRVLVAGGWAQDFSSVLASAELFDPMTGSWTTTGSLHQARTYHAATPLPDTTRPSGRVLVAGGTAGGESSLATAEIYDPMLGTWGETGPMNLGRFLHTATLLRDGRVIVTGGIHVDDYVANAELFDPRTGTWTPTGNMHEARRWHTATLLADGRVLVAGGSRSIDDLALPAELYQASSGLWTRGDDLVFGRQLHSAVRLRGGIVLVAGGFDADGVLASAELYGGGGGPVERWTRTADMLQARSSHTATLLGDGRVLVAGGATRQEHLANAEIYSP